MSEEVKTLVLFALAVFTVVAMWKGPPILSSLLNDDLRTFFGVIMIIGVLAIIVVVFVNAPEIPLGLLALVALAAAAYGSRH